MISPKKGVIVAATTGVTRVVLQGEVGVSDATQGRLKSSCPTACWVVVWHHAESQVGAMAHIDDYTSVASAINRVELLVRSSYDLSLTAGFTAQLYGGREDSFSQEQKQEILKRVQDVEVVDRDGERLQLELKCDDGSVTWTEINKTLEYLQRREYGTFNDLLDVMFGGQNGSDIPFFEAKMALRKEPHIEEIDVVTSDDATPWLEQVQALALNSALPELPLEPHRAAIGKADLDAIRQEAEGCDLGHIFETQDYDRLLRNSVVLDTRFALTDVLLANRSALPLDLTSHGRTSGSVWDVAKKNNNEKALKLLTDLAKAYQL